ncbi:MAG: preprotein translocase subunit SecG [Alphaproteobacteria bacterium]|nr:preprotein translocase subunit SecG [Alphaproteobacteria bacterium]
MGSVLLVIYMMVIILLVALILMQRNSGNALSGLGGGNGADSFLSARGKGNLLTRTTAILATLMFVLALALDLYYKGETKKVESITDVAPLTQTAPAVPRVPNADTEAATTEPSDVAPVATSEEAEPTPTPSPAPTEE